jgi:hypothetical protein
VRFLRDSIWISAVERGLFIFMVIPGCTYVASDLTLKLEPSDGPAAACFTSKIAGVGFSLMKAADSFAAAEPLDESLTGSGIQTHTTTRHA